MITSPYINLLQKTMDVAWLRQQVISNNIANVNTPGYKRREVKFEELLAESLKQRDGVIEKLPDAEVVTVNDTTIKEDGNNVDIDKEYIEQYRTQTQYEYLSRSIADEFLKLRLVLTEGRG